MSLVTSKERGQRIKFFDRSSNTSIQSIILNDPSDRKNPKGKKYAIVPKWDEQSIRKEYAEIWINRNINQVRGARPVTSPDPVELDKIINDMKEVREILIAYNKGEIDFPQKIKDKFSYTYKGYYREWGLLHSSQIPTMCSTKNCKDYSDFLAFAVPSIIPAPVVQEPETEYEYINGQMIIPAPVVQETAMDEWNKTRTEKIQEKLQENQEIELELDGPKETHQTSYYLIGMAAVLIVVLIYFRGKK